MTCEACTKLREAIDALGEALEASGIQWQSYKMDDKVRSCYGALNLAASEVENHTCASAPATPSLFEAAGLALDALATTTLCDTETYDDLQAALRNNAAEVKAIEKMIGAMRRAHDMKLTDWCNLMMAKLDAYDKAVKGGS